MSDGRKRTWKAIQEAVPAPVLALASKLLPAPVKRLINGAVESGLGAVLEKRLADRSAQAVKETRQSVSRERIAEDIRAIPVPPGSVVFVHSSLKSLGFVEGGAATVASLLREIFVTERGGTLALPTISVSGTMHHSLQSRAPFDARETPSGVGAITEHFRRGPGVVRSVHPTHSVGALGERAAWLTQEHHRCGSTFGRGSPYGRLIEADGYLLGLGVDLGPVTFYHTIEDLRDDFPRRVYSEDSPFEADCVDAAGEHHLLSVMAHDPAVSRTRIDTPGGAWIRAHVTQRLEARGVLSWHPVGEGRAWLVRARDMYAELEAMMAEGVTIYSTEAEVAASDHAAIRAAS
ncbi:MAG: AAC(3) family N-acetyltransferase [Ectothiorhodospiraceae bacterium]|nr:AAC(3) family N-acetyltransferase [Ectothiorhodospiraceae bacterium]